MKMMQNRFMNFFFRDGVDIVSWSILIPWLISYVDYCVHGSWTAAVMWHGLLCCSLTCGRLLGQICRSSSTLLQLWPLFILVLSFVCLVLTTRISIVCVLIFLIGFAGSNMTPKDPIPSPSAMVRLKNIDFTVSIPSEATVEAENEVNIQRKLAIFMFATLVSGVIYQESIVDSKWPMIVPFVVASLLFAGMLSMNLYMLRNRFKTSSTKNQKSSNVNSNVGSSNSITRDQSSAISVNSVALATAAIPSTHVDLFTGVVPTVFLKMHRNDEAAARKAYSETLAWRKAFHMDTFLDIPQEHFDEILQWYPHAIHGRSKDGCVVLYEILGKAKPKELTKLGVTNDSLVWHFMLRNEYCFQRLLDANSNSSISNTSNNNSSGKTISNSSSSSISSSSNGDRVGQIMTVIDVKGVGISDITADVISFIKKSSEIMDVHYPGRVCRLVICNAPSWFYSVWSMVARVLPDSVRKKISIINGCKGLLEFIEKDQLPVEYEGSGPHLGDCADHKGFLALAAKWKPVGRSATSAGGVESGGSITKPTSTASGAASTTEKSSSSSQKSPGMFQWMTGNWNSDSNAAGKQAFLGEKNSFHYDPISMSWKMDDNNNSNENEVDSNKMTQDQLEEHGLVLAIQAAHLASKGKKEHGNKSFNDQQGIYDAELGLVNGWELAGQQPHNPYSTLNHQTSIYSRQSPSSLLSSPANASSSSSATTGNADSSRGSSSSTNAGSGILQEVNVTNETSVEAASKMSAAIFLLVVVVYSLSCLIQSCLMTILPVWLATSVNHGGLGCSVLQRGFLLSCGGLLIYLCHICSVSRLTFLLRASPVRVLRISCGVLVLLCFLMPLLLRYMHLDEIILVSTTPELGSVATTTSPGLSISASNSASSASGAAVPTLVQYRSVTVTPNDFAENRTFTALFLLLITSMLLSLTVAMTHICRKASGMLFYLALAPTFTSPTVLITAVAGFADCSGPLVGSLLFCSFYHMKLPAPMDASFTLSICGCACSLIYFLTLLLNVQFRGDFGLILDEGIRENAGMTVGGGVSPILPSHHHHPGAVGMTRGHSTSSSMGNLLEVPMGDLSLLLDAPITGYGTRQHNNVNLKEV